MLIANSSTAGPGGTTAYWEFLEEVEVNGKRFPAGSMTVTVDNPRLHGRREKKGLAVIEFQGRLLLVSGTIRHKKCQLAASEHPYVFIPDDQQFKNGVPFRVRGYRLHEV